MDVGSATPRGRSGQFGAVPTVGRRISPAFPAARLVRQVASACPGPGAWVADTQLDNTQLGNDYPFRVVVSDRLQELLGLFDLSNPARPVHIDQAVDRL